MEASNQISREKPHVALLDPVHPTATRAPKEYQIVPDARVWLVPLAIGVGLLLVSLIALVDEAARARFFFSYLVAYSFILTISLGSLLFVMIQHLTKAEWSVVVRRIPETLTWNFPLLAILTIPILFGMHDLYHWTHEELYVPDTPYYDPLLAGKRIYLNTPFFIVRLIIYFSLWTYMSYRLYTLSVRQDLDQDPMIPVEQRKVSAWGVIVFSLTLAFASFDLLMSTDPHWFSTIYPVYVFAGSFMSAMAVIVLIGLMYRRAGLLADAITREHYHDLGKFIFAFVVFWAYIAFSQYMLIWYGNIPEETLFYRHRSEGGWEIVTQALIFGHFVIPFFVLISRVVKRVLPLLAFMCGWLLFFHYVDLYWLVMPVLDHHFTLHILDLVLWIAFVLIFAAVFILRSKRHATVPYRDPRYGRSLTFENI